MVGILSVKNNRHTYANQFIVIVKIIFYPLNTIPPLQILMSN